MDRRPPSPENPPRQRVPPIRANHSPREQAPPRHAPIGATMRATARPPRPAQTPELLEGTHRVRIINAMLGGWLFVSAFLWPHSPASFTNTWVVGALLAFSSLFAFRTAARLACATLAIWLVLSTFAIAPRTPLTVWHNLAVALAALISMFLPRLRRTRAPT
jgi:hypothetical protein